MAKTRTPKPIDTRIGLYVTSERDRKYGDYFHIKAYAVTIGTTAYERRRIDQGESFGRVNSDTIRNIGEEPYNDLYLANLRAQCQGVSTDTPRHLYAFETEYRDLFSVDRHQARRMAKTLDTIEKRMETVQARFGRPSGFGQYLARLASAIRADWFVFPKRADGSDYRHMDHRITSVSDGIYQVDAMADAWIREIEIAEQLRVQELRQRALADADATPADA